MGGTVYARSPYPQPGIYVYCRTTPEGAAIVLFWMLRLRRISR